MSMAAACEDTKVSLSARVSHSTAKCAMHSRNSFTPLFNGLSFAQALCQSCSKRSTSLVAFMTDIRFNLRAARVGPTFFRLCRGQKLLIPIVIE